MKNKPTRHWYFQRLAGVFSRIYSSANNPLYNLGNLSIWMFIIACVSGVYIFFFYDVDPGNAYQSVEKISAHPFNAIIRSIHRYSSDLLVIFIVIHFIQTLLTGKYKRVLSWISGVVSFLVVLLIGITGFILVWDEKGKLIGYLTAKFFTALPIFDPSIAGSFISNNLDYIGGFFKVSLFGHMFFSVFLIIVLWFHVMRIARPKLFPAKVVWLYTGFALLTVCIIFPVKSDPSAQERFIPYNTTFDWYYFFGYYLMKIFSVPANWAIMLLSGFIVAVVPFLRRDKKKAPAVIDLDKCDACNRCAEDCPYEAIDMLIYKGSRKAILESDKCVSCGICLASCKEKAITMEGFPDLFTGLAPQKDKLTVLSCSQYADVEIPVDISCHKQMVNCLGDLHTNDVEQYLNDVSEGVLMLGCEDCYFRYGKDLAVSRMNRKRPPAFSKNIPLNRVQLITTNHFTPDAVRRFADSLSAVSGQDERGTTMKVMNYFKANHAAAAAIFCAFFLLVPFLSTSRVSFFDKEKKLLILNFKYISSPTEFTQVESTEKQMQYGKPMVTKRSAIKVVVKGSNGNILFNKKYRPRGLRQDIAIFVYKEIMTNDTAATVSVTELAYPDKKLELNNISLHADDGTIIATSDERLVVLKSVIAKRK